MKKLLFILGVILAPIGFFVSVENSMFWIPPFLTLIGFVLIVLSTLKFERVEQQDKAIEEITLDTSWNDCLTLINWSDC